MKAKLLHIIRQWPFFLLLLPLFYLLHQVNENYAPGLFSTAFILLMIYTGAGIALALLLSPLLKSYRKAALASLYLLSFNFFFGNLHDTAKKILGKNSFLVSYSFIIAVTLLLLLIIVISLRRTKKGFGRTFLFLNVLFMVLTVFELVTLAPMSLKKNNYDPPPLVPRLMACDTCSKPDVYVIIADEYAGRQELADIFSFDNAAFENDLQTRGFHIVNNTSSNYNATVYSMASLFNMGYIKLTGKDLVTQGDMLLCRSIINRNNLGAYLQQQGYSVYNASFFDVQGKKKAVNNYYFHPKSRILSFGTFINRFRLDAGFNFFSREKIIQVEKNDFTNDETVDSLTRKTVLDKTPGPKFVYTHFTRPHHPYYVNRDGLPFTYGDSLKGFDRTKKEYTEHLLYTNKRLLQLVDHIRQHSARPPVILLASDHGFRQLPENADKKYNFMNLCAVYLPNGRYAGFYDGMTTVNIFRVILNAQFGQQLPLLKDSTSFLIEKALW